MGLNLLFNYSLTENESQLLFDALENSAAEDGAESEHPLLQIVKRMRSQLELQTARRGEIVKCACADCKRSVEVPNELLKGKWLDTSAEFFCPFCDVRCEHPRCVKCRLDHQNNHNNALLTGGSAVSG